MYSRLQRRVLTTILALVLAPMLIVGGLVVWISTNFETHVPMASGSDALITNKFMLFSAIAGLGVLMGLLVGWWISRAIVKPINALHQSVIRVANQDFDTKVTINSQDELGELAGAFNAMAARLREVHDEQIRTYQRDKLVALGEISAALAHEIRNPIGVINTAAALLERAETQPDKKIELLRMIRQEGSRVAGLVGDFLQLSRFRRPESVLIDPVLPLERALSVLLATYPDVLAYRDFRHELAQITADPSLLERAWHNLLINAIHAVQGRGGLYLDTRIEGGNIVLMLEDNGPGIPIQALPRIFEPFFTTKPQGTGLGLSLAHTLVESNGGKLEVLPQETKGARFAMKFPIALFSPPSSL